LWIVNAQQDVLSLTKTGFMIHKLVCCESMILKTPLALLQCSAIREMPEQPNDNHCDYGDSGDYGDSALNSTGRALQQAKRGRKPQDGRVMCTVTVIHRNTKMTHQRYDRRRQMLDARFAHHKGAVRPLRAGIICSA
jgi:hypothetical protein